MNIDGNIYTGGNNVKFSYVVPRVTSLFDPDNSADGRIIVRLASVLVNYCAIKCYLSYLLMLCTCDFSI